MRSIFYFNAAAVMLTMLAAAKAPSLTRSDFADTLLQSQAAEPDRADGGAMPRAAVYRSDYSRAGNWQAPLGEPMKTARLGSRAGSSVSAGAAAAVGAVAVARSSPTTADLMMRNLIIVIAAVLIGAIISIAGVMYFLWKSGVLGVVTKAAGVPNPVDELPAEAVNAVTEAGGDPAAAPEEKNSGGRFGFLSKMKMPSFGSGGNAAKKT